MGSRLLALAVAFAALVSSVVLVAMLAAPLVPQAAGDTDADPSASIQPSPAVAADLPPLGLFLLRGPYAFGPCLGLELSPPSYPIGDDAGPGVARVLWWERGMTGCDSRTGDVAEVEASVERLARQNAPDETSGYLVAFELPLAAGVDGDVALTILAARSTQELLQVTDAAGLGQGLVFDRVESIDPLVDPLPSPTPVAALQPNGLYLLQGPFGPDGPCLVLELDDSSYPADPTATGTANIRWWERAVADPDDPAECLRRSGDVHEASASVLAVSDATGGLTGYAIGFSVPLSGGGAAEEAEIQVLVGDSSRDQLRAVAVHPEDGLILIFHRVDSIDPPLAPAPSG